MGKPEAGDLVAQISVGAYDVAFVPVVGHLFPTSETDLTERVKTKIGKEHNVIYVNTNSEKKLITS